MDAGGMRRTLVRLAHEIAERNENLNDVVLLGIKRGGEVVADRIRERLSEAEGIAVPSFGIDIGMQRDDLVSAFFVPDYTAERPDFSIENKIAVLCDDVLNTGRSVRAALEGGAVLVCNVGPGDFTDNGHFFVVTGIDGDGNLRINDPYSAERSNRAWDVDTVLGQTKALWAYRLA